MNRVLQAVRLHYVHPLVALAMPALIVGLAFVANLAIWHLTPASAEDGGFTGGLSALYITLLIGYVQSVTQLLPFAMGISLSRRAFYLGTAAVAVIESLAYGVALSALTELEDATNGWGAGLAFWAPGPTDVDDPALQVLVSGAPILLVAFLGIGMGVISKRWGSSGAWRVTLGSTVFFGGLAVLVTWLEAWSSIGSWFADQSVVTLAVGLPVTLAIAVAVLSWGGIRRVVP